MTEENYSFRCCKYKPNLDGGIGFYLLEIYHRESGETEELFVTPKELLSPAAMKKILIGRQIVYSTTRKKHEEMLKDVFVNPLIAI